MTPMPDVAATDLKPSNAHLRFGYAAIVVMLTASWLGIAWINSGGDRVGVSDERAGYGSWITATWSVYSEDRIANTMNGVGVSPGSFPSGEDQEEGVPAH